VNRAKDICEKLGVRGALLELRQTPLHLIEPDMAFDQELAYQVVHLTLIGRRVD
jgi:hypothetical protein